MTSQRFAISESGLLVTRSENASDGNIRPAKILIVEDDPDVAQVLAEILGHFGYEACRARDGLHALSMWRHGFRPDLVLLDLVMPNMDGYRFRGAQREEPAFARIPTVVITAQASPDLRALDAQGCIKKPFDVEALLAEIERQLRRRPRASVIEPSQ
jgi:two-component system response regulator MprA